LKAGKEAGGPYDASPWTPYRGKAGRNSDGKGKKARLQEIKKKQERRRVSRKSPLGPVGSEECNNI